MWGLRAGRALGLVLTLWDSLWHLCHVGTQIPQGAESSARKGGRAPCLAWHQEGLWIIANPLPCFSRLKRDLATSE